MGQKTNPIGFRLGETSAWKSIWFDKYHYSYFLFQDLQIRKYIEDKCLAINLVIGEIHLSRSGGLSNCICIKLMAYHYQVKKINLNYFDQMAIHLKQFTNSDVSLTVLPCHGTILPEAKIIATVVAKLLQKRKSISYIRRDIFKMCVKATGFKLRLSGRLNGVRMARYETIQRGSVPLHTISSNIDYATEIAYTPYGVLGIKVWLYK